MDLVVDKSSLCFCLTFGRREGVRAREECNWIISGDVQSRGNKYKECYTMDVRTKWCGI